ncbi:DUF6247 family protein [Sphaerimonospora cavernae]|uniref:DUF6247 family protein n=1 Tax=Sphaerimonospora cavernae TaxID=1740611 RepID=A0ABV6U5Z0_9ACTN
MTAQHQEPGSIGRTPQQIRTSLRDDRSPRAIRAALPIEDLDAFDRQYRKALRTAADDLDLTPLHECVESWWRHAVLRADPVAYQDMIDQAEEVQRRVESGEPTGGVAWEEVEARLRRRISAGQ